MVLGQREPAVDTFFKFDVQAQTF
uniref:Uncharacterized protein n=1 Tax=Anguilla anguilla TaxID=7936 RepID=A0A0E9T676_ANGAN